MIPVDELKRRVLGYLEDAPDDASLWLDLFYILVHASGGSYIRERTAFLKGRGRQLGLFDKHLKCKEK